MLQRPCPDCGFDAAGYRRRRGLPAVLHAATARWPACSPRRASPTGPTPDVWSPLEYVCHVRDVYRVFTGRAAADAGRGRPRASPTGTRTRRRCGAGTPSRTRPSSPTSWPTPPTPAAALFAGVGRRPVEPARAPQRRHRLHRRDPGPVPRPRGRAPPARRARLTLRADPHPGGRASPQAGRRRPPAGTCGSSYRPVLRHPRRTAAGAPIGSAGDRHQARARGPRDGAGEPARPR